MPHQNCAAVQKYCRIFYNLLTKNRGTFIFNVGMAHRFLSQTNHKSSQINKSCNLRGKTNSPELCTLALSKQSKQDVSIKQNSFSFLVLHLLGFLKGPRVPKSTCFPTSCFSSYLLKYSSN
jgi:hypothetical protein